MVRAPEPPDPSLLRAFPAVPPASPFLRRTPRVRRSSATKRLHHRRFVLLQVAFQESLRVLPPPERGQVLERNVAKVIRELPPKAMPPEPRDIPKPRLLVGRVPPVRHYVPRAGSRGVHRRREHPPGRAVHRRPILRHYGVRRASVFGSYARGQENPESDLDLLVELPPGSSLLDLVGLEQDLTAELGIKVEATTYGSLHPLMRDQVLADRRTIL